MQIGPNKAHFGYIIVWQQQVNLKEIETENVFLFFSDLDISENEISILNSIDNNKSMKDQYKIIWIPIVDWTVDQMQTKFEKLRSKMPNTWYRLPKFSFDLGIQYINEKWEFKNRPIVVVMNSQGMVVHRDAYHMIALGINPLRPITGVPDSPLPNGEDSVGQILLGSLHIDILTWVNFFNFSNNLMHKHTNVPVVRGLKIPFLYKWIHFIVQ